MKPASDCDLEQGLIGAIMNQNDNKILTDPTFVLITEGRPTLGVTDQASIIRAVQIALSSINTNHCTLHTVGIGGRQDSDLLSSLCQLTHQGCYLFSNSTTDCLSQVLVDLLAQVQQTTQLKLWSNPLPKLLPPFPSEISSLLKQALLTTSEEEWLTLGSLLEKEAALLEEEEQRYLLHSLVTASKPAIPLIRGLLQGPMSSVTARALAVWVGSESNLHGTSKTSDTVWTRSIEGSSSPSEGELVIAGRFLVKGGAVGKGAYGTIFTALDQASNTEVAVKKITYVNKTRSSLVLGIRELASMRVLSRHPNIVSLFGAEVTFMFGDSESKQADLWVVMELLPIDLQQLIDSKQVLSVRHHACITFQLLSGLHHMHCSQLIHRDLKPSNILLDRECNLRICDFGLARGLEEQSVMTEYVVTRWYRAPEVIRAQSYGPPVDVWSVGCIFSELINRRPLFPGRDPAHQLNLISETAESVHMEDNDVSRLIRKMLVLDASLRISTSAALSDPFFSDQGLVRSDDIGTVAALKDDTVLANLSSHELLDRLVIEANSALS